MRMTSSNSTFKKAKKFCDLTIQHKELIFMGGTYQLAICEGLTIYRL